MRNAVKYDGGVAHKLDASEDTVPSFQRAGTIVPRKDRFRRSSTQMLNDPYTLVWPFIYSAFLAKFRLLHLSIISSRVWLTNTSIIILEAL